MGIQEVATLAGVSVATVSRVLNNNEHVGEEYRERVRQAATELRYNPDRVARSLRMKSRLAIAVLVPDIANPHFAEVVRAVENEAYQQGNHVLVCNTDEQPDKQASYLHMLIGERVRGLIMAPADPADPEISRLIDAGTAFVAFDRPVSDPRADTVLVDNAGGTRSVTSLLIEAGHRDVVLLAGRRDVQSGAERVLGYRQAMSAAGLEPYVVDGDFQSSTGYDGVAHLLDSSRRFSALVVSNNMLTVGALSCLRDRGVKIPDDVALIAVDDPPWAGLTDPPLTTLAQPVAAMAASAVRLLFQRIESGPGQPSRVVHDFEFCRRSSCGTQLDHLLP